MKIVCIIKQVPDAEARVRANDGQVDLEGATFVIDGMDEYGVEEALRIREGGAAVDEVVVLALGPKRFEDAIRTALAMGADRAIHIETDAYLDVIASARILAKVIEREEAGLVFVGGKEADWDSAALGAAVAECLNWPHSDWTTKLTLNPPQTDVIHDSDDGSEHLTLPLPCVITTQQGLNDPRYPTLPNIMKSKRKPLEKHSLDDVGAEASLTALLSVEIQTKARRNTIIEGDAKEAAQKLVSLLLNEAKVLG